MHDLRWDQEEADAATHARLKAVTQPAHVLTPAQLRTVPMPDLRSGTERELDAAVRQLDCRTGPERVAAEMAVLREAIERLADAVQVLMLEREARQAEASAIKIHVDYPTNSAPTVQPQTITGGPVTTVKGPITLTDANGNRWKYE